MFLRLLPLRPPEIVSTVTNDSQEDLLTTVKKNQKSTQIQRHFATVNNFGVR